MGTQCECRAPAASPASLGTACRETQCSCTPTDGNWRQGSVQIQPARPQESTHSPRVEQARAPEPWPGSAGPLSLAPAWSPMRGYLCTAAWTRCSRAVQSLPPLKPTQSWTRLYWSKASSIVRRAAATFCPRAEPARTGQLVPAQCPAHVPLAWPQGLGHFTLWIHLISIHTAEPLLVPEPRACSTQRSGPQCNRDHEGTGELWHYSCCCTVCSQTLPPPALAEVTGPIPTCVG